MWTWLNCHLLGRHQEVVKSDRESIHLLCLRCGRRSAGWPLSGRRETPASAGIWSRTLTQSTPRRPS